MRHGFMVSWWRGVMVRWAVKSIGRPSRIAAAPSLPGAPPNRAEALVGAGFSFVCELFLHAEALVYLPDPPLAGEDGSKPVARASAKPSTPHRGASAPPAISRMASPRGYCAALERFTASLKKGEGESLAGYFISAMPGDLPRMLVRLPVAIPAKGLGAWIGGNFAAPAICIGPCHARHAVLWHQGVTASHAGKGCPFCGLP